jgi:peptidyl-prolyl cis-trans isomerase C
MRILLVMVLISVVALGCAKEAEEVKEKEAEGPKVVQPVPPGNVRASHILISYQGVEGINATRTKEEARKLADDLVGRVKAGEGFEKLAETYSDCPSAQKQGDLGFFRKGRMVKPFEDAAFGLEPGMVSGVVETKFGYHIIKRTQ